MVRVARLERAASTSQMSRATNCTTPGYLVVMIIARNSCDSKFFPVCSHLCGQSRFLARFPGQAKSRKCPCCKGFRALAVPIVDRRKTAPKAGALPTALHPGIRFWHGCLRASAADTALTRGIQAKILYDTMRAKSSQTLDEPRRLPYNKPMSYCSYHL